MQNFWFRLSMPFLFGGLFALVLWGIFSAAVALGFLLLLSLGVMLYYARQLRKLDIWLRDPQTATMPEAGGVWDEVFSGLYRMVKHYNQTKQALSNELVKMEQATAALPEGVTILSPDHRIEWSNPMSQQHFGLNPEFDRMQDITYLVRQPEFAAYLHADISPEPLLMRSQRNEDVLLSIKLVPYGTSNRLLISRDVTQLERLEAMRRNFVANVSHELRTPLTVVAGFLENLQDMQDLAAEDAQRALQLMAGQVARMENLVADLLTLSRLESEHQLLHEERVDVVGLLKDLLQEGRMLSAGAHHIEGRADCMLGLSGNLEELRSAFGNLVSNAIRYTPKGGDINIEWSRQGETVSFSVRDSGIGVDPQHLPHLTERFYRVDRSRSRETGGTGLGLAIVKHVAMRHQARLEVQSTAGKGSTFSLVFPLARTYTIE